MDDSRLASRFLDIIENDIVPLTQKGVESGSKVFGAAILLKSDLSLIVAESNNETENPRISNDVISAAGPMMNFIRSAKEEFSSSLASTAISKSVAPPRLLRRATIGACVSVVDSFSTTRAIASRAPE